MRDTMDEWITNQAARLSGRRLGRRCWRVVYRGHVIEVVSSPFRPMELRVDGRAADTRLPVLGGGPDVPVLTGHVTHDELGPVLIEVYLRSWVKQRVEIRIGNRIVAADPGDA